MIVSLKCPQMRTEDLSDFTTGTMGAAHSASSTGSRMLCFTNSSSTWFGQHRSLLQIPVGCPAPHKTHSCVGQEWCSPLSVLPFVLDRCLANQDKKCCSHLGPTNWIPFHVLHTVVNVLSAPNTAPLPPVVLGSSTVPLYVRRRVVVSCRGLLGQSHL